MRKSVIILAILALFSLVGFVSASTAPVAPIPVTCSQNGTITVTFVSSNAGYDNEFGVYLPTFMKLGMGHEAAPGTVYNTGIESPANQPIVLYLKNPSGDLFRSDIKSSDGIYHAMISQSGDVYTVSFEDMYGGGDLDYNDIVLNVTCHPDPPIPSPEFPTAVLPLGLVIGVVGAVLYLRTTKN